MRLLLACGVFFMAPGAAPAQTLGPASLQSLNFLLGTWAAEGAGPLPQITEFRWIRRQENPMVVGGRWTGDVYNCPWCVTRGIMVAYYDTASSEVRVRFAEKTPWAAGFRMVSAHPGSAQFMSVAEPSRHTYRLTCKLQSRNVLLITLEEAVPDRENAFSTVARWSFHRLFLVTPSRSGGGCLTFRCVAPDSR